MRRKCALYLSCACLACAEPPRLGSASFVPSLQSVAAVQSRAARGCCHHPALTGPTRGCSCRAGALPVRGCAAQLPQAPGPVERVLGPGGGGGRPAAHPVRESGWGRGGVGAWARNRNCRGHALCCQAATHLQLPTHICSPCPFPWHAAEPAAALLLTSPPPRAHLL